MRGSRILVVNVPAVAHFCSAVKEEGGSSQVGNNGDVRGCVTQGGKVPILSG